MVDASYNTEDTLWSLEGILSDGKTWFIPIDKFPFRIGRTQDCHLSLASKKISRNHAEIFEDGIFLRIRDIGSANGTYINGKQIKDNALLKSGDIVHFDKLEFRVVYKNDDDLSDSKTNLDLDIKKDLQQHFVSCEHEFHQMLEQRAVTPHFQPIVRLGNVSTIGYEVLGRGSFKELPSSPLELFKIATTLGRVSELSELFRYEGVRIGKTLPHAPLLFVNTHQFETYQQSLMTSLYEIREIAPTTGIVLEIHEKVVSNLASMRKLRSALSELNIELAYDDFGAGHARLIELTEVPPDYLKFDMSLIRNIHIASKRMQQMVETLVKMARDFEIVTLAEGIECKEESEVCAEIGFDYAQGYHFGRPNPIDRLLNINVVEKDIDKMDETIVCKRN